MHLVSVVVWNYYFDLVPQFYFLKWNRYFWACEKLQNSSYHFWKHKSVFLQILHQSSVLLDITLCTFLAQTLNTLFKRNPLKCTFLRLLVLRSTFVKFLMSLLNWQVNSPAKFASFFIVMTHNSSVNFKLIHFPLWMKGFDQSSNFEIFQVHSWIFYIFLISFSKPQLNFCQSMHYV